MEGRVDTGDGVVDTVLLFAHTRDTGDSRLVGEGLYLLCDSSDVMVDLLFDLAVEFLDGELTKSLFGDAVDIVSDAHAVRLIDRFLHLEHLALDLTFIEDHRGLVA